VVWRQSFWPLDTIALNVTNMTNWLLMILNPHQLLDIPQAKAHMFQIFADVACDHLWFIRNKTHHKGLIPNALIISSTINKTILEYHSAWKIKLAISCEVWQSHSPFFFQDQL
jgi:hypothetical protein